jgi:hypothetical protein
MRYSSRIVATMALISIFNQRRLSARGPRLRPATKTDKEGIGGAEAARLMSSAPPSCRRIAANVSTLRELWRRTHTVFERTSGHFQRANLNRYNALS